MDTPPPAPPVPRIVGSDDNGNFILELERGTYFGHIKDGEPHGVGTITFKKGNIWKGIWENGKRVKGTTTRLDGKQFTGEWVDDLLYNGSGTASYDNGNTFTGEWKEGNPYTGKGFVHYSSGVYEGEFLEGNMHGKGKLTLNSGDIFEGQWKNDKLNGKGEYRNKRIHYIGDFLDDKKHGIGKLVLLSDGSIYEGDFKNNVKKGKGKIIYKDGSTYEGDWDYDVKHGDGKLTDTKGKITFGLWKSNELSETYPIFKIAEKALADCKTILHDPYKSDDIIMLYNPPRPTFDLRQTFDCVEKCTLNICNFMFLKTEFDGVEGEIYRKIDGKTENPYTKVLMEPEFVKPYVLLVESPSVQPSHDGSNAGGKRKLSQKSKRKQTNKRMQKNKRQTKKK